MGILCSSCAKGGSNINVSSKKKVQRKGKGAGEASSQAEKSEKSSTHLRKSHQEVSVPLEKKRNSSSGHKSKASKDTVMKKKRSPPKAKKQSSPEVSVVNKSPKKSKSERSPTKSGAKTVGKRKENPRKTKSETSPSKSSRVTSAEVYTIINDSSKDIKPETSLISISRKASVDVNSLIKASSTKTKPEKPSKKKTKRATKLRSASVNTPKANESGKLLKKKRKKTKRATDVPNAISNTDKSQETVVEKVVASRHTELSGLMHLTRSDTTHNKAENPSKSNHKCQKKKHQKLKKGKRGTQSYEPLDNLNSSADLTFKSPADRLSVTENKNHLETLVTADAGNFHDASVNHLFNNVPGVYQQQRNTTNKPPEQTQMHNSVQGNHLYTQFGSRDHEFENSNPMGSYLESLEKQQQDYGYNNSVAYKHGGNQGDLLGRNYEQTRETQASEKFSNTSPRRDQPYLGPQGSFYGRQVGYAHPDLQKSYPGHQQSFPGFQGSFSGSRYDHHLNNSSIYMHKGKEGQAEGNSVQNQKNYVSKTFIELSPGRRELNSGDHKSVSGHRQQDEEYFDCQKDQTNAGWPLMKPAEQQASSSEVSIMSIEGEHARSEADKPNIHPVIWNHDDDDQQKMQLAMPYHRDCAPLAWKASENGGKDKTPRVPDTDLKKYYALHDYGVDLKDVQSLHEINPNRPYSPSSQDTTELHFSTVECASKEVEHRDWNSAAALCMEELKSKFAHKNEKKEDASKNWKAHPPSGYKGLPHPGMAQRGEMEGPCNQKVGPSTVKKWPTVISPPVKRRSQNKGFPKCPARGINVMSIHIDPWEFMTLKEPANADEKVITAYLNLEARNTSTFVVGQDVIDSWQYGRDLLRGIRLCDYDKLIGPFDPIRMRFGAPGNWILFYANIKRGTLSILDSRRQSHDGHQDQFIHFRNFWEKRKERKISWLEKFIRCGQQQDNISDGIFCMLHGLCIIRGQKPSSVKQKNIEKFRFHIAHKLLNAAEKQDQNMMSRI